MWKWGDRFARVTPSSSSTRNMLIKTKKGKQALKQLQSANYIVYRVHQDLDELNLICCFLKQYNSLKTGKRWNKNNHLTSSTKVKSKSLVHTVSAFISYRRFAITYLGVDGDFRYKPHSYSQKSSPTHEWKDVGSNPNRWGKAGYLKVMIRI